MTPDEHRRALLERGFTVFEAVQDPAWITGVRDDLVALHDRLGRPTPWSADPLEIAPGVVLCAAGLSVRSFLTQLPRWVDQLLHPAVVAAVRGAIGDDMSLEVAGAVLCDHTRPFFGWHTHVDGVDDGYYRRLGRWPRPRGAERIMTLLYLDDLDEDGGPVLVFPRAAGEPVDPPGDLDARTWPGQVELRLRRGDLLALEQCTWHAIPAVTRAGLRGFVGCTYAARGVSPASFRDPGLAEFAGGGPLLRSVLPRAR